MVFFVGAIFRAAFGGAIKNAARTGARASARRGVGRGRGGNTFYLPGGSSGQVQLSSKDIVAAMQSPRVRADLERKAAQIAMRANVIIQNEGLQSITAEVESGTRPKGRPYSRAIIYDGARFEWGTQNTERWRILGRASEGIGGSVRVSEDDL